jgi:enoyl-CoA hydratase/carnithine racemase
MKNAMRPSTLTTLGLGNTIDIFANGKLPASAGELVDQVFGPAGQRGALVVSGANGIVGAGKVMQLGSRLAEFDIPIVALDFPGVPDGIGQQYPGLVRAFGADGASKVMGNVVQFSYDGKSLPPRLRDFNPKFLLEAIPEILEIKKAHYAIFNEAYPGIEIRSVTSGFPQSQLGVGIAHPAFPHEINKIWEIVENEPSAVTQLLWALGLIPMVVSDDWSFVLDVFFCGLTLAASRYKEATNMPYWKIDKFVRRLIGPNPFRAHDAIGAAGANFLTWSCLHHLAQHYGGLFTPSSVLEEKKTSGENWYPMNHFRPLVDWALSEEDNQEFEARILGPMIQMTSLMVKENRSHMATMNSIGELCAQFTRGLPAVIRARGADASKALVDHYHTLHPEAAGGAWHPEVFEAIESPEWQQLYVNAEHDGTVGVIAIGREAYNSDVNAEMNRAIDWLKAEGIDRVIVTGDFHLTTQLTGADTGDFFPAMEDAEMGVAIAKGWSETARRLHDEFKVSVGFVNGKRALGGMLELLMHCHHLVAVDDASLGMPEVTLPVVPGMEGCHWPFRRVASEHWPRLLSFLLEGRAVRAPKALDWLLDFAGPLEESLAVAWNTACGTDGGVPPREFAEGALQGVADTVPPLGPAGDPGMEAGREAILANIKASTAVPVAEALEIQARHSGDFMPSKACLGGVIGGMYKKTVKI